jgi:hypothetical protein
MFEHFPWSTTDGVLPSSVAAVHSRDPGVSPAGFRWVRCARPQTIDEATDALVPT